PVDGLGRDVADGVDPVRHDVPLLLRVDASQLERAELGDRLHAEVVRGDGRADEARARRLERDVPGLHPAQRLVLQPFVPHLEVVVRVEFALAVEVDVQVQALSHDASRADRVLGVGADRGEARGAAGQGLLQVDRAAVEIAKLVGLELEAHVELHADVGERPGEGGRRRGDYDGTRRLGRGGRGGGRRSRRRGVGPPEDRGPHRAPIGFALAAFTLMMLLRQVAQQFGNLVGKGLPWSVILEVFLLSVPFIIAMTLPMAVLVAVLYAFSQLAGDHEITAMKASGVSLGRLVAPVLSAAALVAALAFLWSDQVLPRSNHRLRTLLVDIQRKKPSFSLKEQVINEVVERQFFLRAARIDPATNRLRDVTIYDLGDPEVVDRD